MQKLNRILHLSEVTTKLEALDLQVGGGKPEQFQKVVRAYAAIYIRSMSGAHVQLDRRSWEIATEEANTPARLFQAKSGGDLSRSELNAKWRIALSLIAEADCGKSEEIRAWWNTAVISDELAGFTAVQAVATSRQVESTHVRN